MIRLALLAALLPPGIPDLVTQLADDDIEVRERATQELVRAGELARPDLERASASPDSEVAARARAILSALSPLQVALDAPDLIPKAQDVAVQLVILNPTKEEICYFRAGFKEKVVLLELHEDPERAPIGVQGYYGRRLAGCQLRESDFFVIQPGGRLESRLELRGRAMEVSRPLLERFPILDRAGVGLAGRYTFFYSYRFNRDAYTRRCPNKCPGHDDPEMPWNRAVTRPLEASVEFTLR